MKTALAAALLIGLAAPALAQPAPEGFQGRATTLNLSAYGEVKIAPDMASVTVGVVDTTATAAQAVRANADQMELLVIAALHRQGLAARDIQTSGVSLNPDYLYANNQPPKLTGYKASNTVTVTVRELGKLGPIIDAISAAGANEINGVRFGLADPSAAEDDARRRAVKALAAKAELYAGATGYRVARLMNLREGAEQEPAPPPLGQVTVTAARKFAPTPIQAGELTARVDVLATYELAR